jgi:peptidoglycan hydrolase CwlO-like protein|tara:strand:- start:125 stop:349 length:225 start_codon:yes stop_codon:yes gene_type:complete
MADIDVANDLVQINTQLEELVAKANELNTQRENLMQQIHNLNGIAMYLRGKGQENGEGVTEELPQEEFPPPEGK